MATPELNIVILEEGAAGTSEVLLLLADQPPQKVKGPKRGFGAPRKKLMPQEEAVHRRYQAQWDEDDWIEHEQMEKSAETMMHIINV